MFILKKFNYPECVQYKTQFTVTVTLLIKSFAKKTNTMYK